MARIPSHRWTSEGIPERSKEGSTGLSEGHEECSHKGGICICKSQAAKSLERGGADFIVICTNTMHRVAPQVQENINIPILHIAQATARRLKQRNIKRAALLGTIYTMEQDFYKDILIQEGIEVLTPQGKDAQLVNRVIYSELCLGVVSERSKREYLRIIGSLAQKGAQGVILGCTEIGLLIRQEDTPLPVFDTARIHAEQAALHAAGKA